MNSEASRPPAARARPELQALLPGGAQPDQAAH
jgi:hypothetical protein